MSTASHLPTCAVRCDELAGPDLLLHPAASQPLPLAWGDFLARPPSIEHYCTSSARLTTTACTITLARAFIVLLAFARFCYSTCYTCPSVLACSPSCCTLRALQSNWCATVCLDCPVLFDLCRVPLLLLCERSVCNWSPGVCICVCERLPGRLLCYLLEIRGLSKERDNTGCDIERGSVGLGLSWGEGRGMATTTTMLALGSLLLSNITHGSATSNSG